MGNFVYLGDKLNEGGGCLSGVTASVRGMDEIQAFEWCNVWSVKMKDRVYKACVRAAMVYGGEISVMRKEEDSTVSELKELW